MAEERNDAQERSEPATAKRRQDARAEGQVPRSTELSAAIVVLSGTAALATVGGPPLAAFAVGTMQTSARLLSSEPWEVATGASVVQGLAIRMVLALLPFALVVAGVTTLVNVVQARGVVSWKPVTPKWSHLNPVSGLRRLVGWDALINLVKALLKLVAVTTVTFMLVAGAWPELISLSQLGPGGVAAVMNGQALKLAALSGIAFLVLAGADYAVQWVKHERGLRMTRQEIVRETRESEGDPMVKARLRSVARSRARRRMLQAVPTADVVVVNPVHIAVALRYDVGASGAPVVVAMGQRKLAERIRDLARSSGVPIVENRPVARALFSTGAVGKAIPPALYAAVAEILAYVYRLRGRRIS